MARPPITAKGELLFRQQLNAALDYVEGLSGGGVSDGDKGDITVSGGGTVWTIDVAPGATDLSYTAATRVLASSTGADATLPLVVAAGDAGLMTGADKTKLDGIATGAQVNVATDLSYTAATRLLASSTGTDVTLPLATGTDAGLMPSADFTKLAAISGTNTGDQTTIVGITGTKAQFDTAVTDGNFLYVGDVTTNATHTGEVTGATALTIAADAVTYAKMQNVSAASRLIGRGDSGSGDPQEITLGANLTMTGTTLAASGGGGSTIYYGHLQSDYTLTSQTAAQKLFNWSTNGALTLTTGVYRFRCLIYLTTMSGTSGNGAFHLLGSGTATLARILYHVTGVDNTTPLVSAARGGSASVTSASAASMVTAATGTGLTAIIEGVFDMTVAGTIIPSIALVTAAAAVVKTGSFFECERIANTATATSSGWT